MLHHTSVTVIGRLRHQADIRRDRHGKPVATLKLDVPDGYDEPPGDVVDPDDPPKLRHYTRWHCVAFGAVAENLGGVPAGARLVATGSLTGRGPSSPAGLRLVVHDVGVSVISDHPRAS